MIVRSLLGRLSSLPRVLVRRFLDMDRRGNVAIIFALAFVPILAGVGAAIDLSRAYVVKARLTSAMDAAGLAAGATLNKTNAELEQVAQDYFAANYPEEELGAPGELQVDVSDTVIQLSVSAELPTVIMSAFGIDTMDVASGVQITREQTMLEVVMVLDNTGSMYWSGKIGALRDAATELVEIMFGDTAVHENLRMALVPFVTSVNVQGEEFDMAWMDTTGAATYHGVNFDESAGEVNHFDLFDGISNATWKGCVEMRAEPYDLTDDAPNAGNPDTLWVPYFWPAEPKYGYGFSNKYKNDGDYLSAGILPTDYAGIQAYTGKYDGASGSIDEVARSTSGPNKSCPTPITPLNDTKQDVLDAVNAMESWASSGTNIAAGLAWGWRVLSPTAPYTTGSEYDDPDSQKALILLTDGKNEVVRQRNHNYSDYTGYGYLSVDRLGTQSTSAAAAVVDGKVEQMCEDIKALDVRVYTITFQLNSTALQDVFRACATEPSLYFDSPTNEKLRQVFETIAQDLSNLRVSK